MGAAHHLNWEFYFPGGWPRSCCLQYGESPAEGREAAESGHQRWHLKREKRHLGSVKTMDSLSFDF